MLKNGNNDLCGRSRIRGALKNDKLSGPKVWNDRFNGLSNRRKIRLAISIQRCWDAYAERVRGRDPRKIGGSDQAIIFPHFFDNFAGDVPDIAFAFGEFFDFVLVDVESQNLKSLFREQPSERQAHVPKPDDPSRQAPRCSLLDKLIEGLTAHFR